MISSNHIVELFVEGERIEVGKDGLDIKFSNTIQTPTKLTASTTTYSYSFNIPLTPNNSKILGDINVLSKKNKFNRRYNAILYADGIEIFNGSMKISSISDNKAKCNLYVPKLNTIESIFGDTKLNEIDWKVDFDGIETINEVNADLTTKYFFPFIAYNLFNKLPSKVSESGYEYYTDKKTIDDTCRFYFNSFVPSLNMVETMKKCFELKGLKLEGDIVNNDILNEIYLSNSIDGEQDPEYNYGNPLIGSTEFNIKFKNYWGSGSNPTFITENSFIWDFPTETKDGEDEIVFAKLNDADSYDSAVVWNLLNKDAFTDSDIYNMYINLTTKNNNGNMLVNGGVQIPADGYYQIECIYDFGVDKDFEGIPRANVGTKVNGKDAYLNLTNARHLPVEFQLLKFDTLDSDMDSLNHNITYYGHYPNESRKVANENGTNKVRYSSAMANTFDAIAGKDGLATIAVDPYNNENYVCGVSMDNWGAKIGYRKNGKSWDAESEFEETVAIYDAEGYYKIEYKGDSDTGVAEKSKYNYNNLLNFSPRYKRRSGSGNDGCPFTYPTTTPKGKSYTRRSSGTTAMIIKLKKGEMLVPYLQERHYCEVNNIDKDIYYPIDIDLTIKVTAVGVERTNREDLYYNVETNFPKQLQLGNFLSSGETITNWLVGIQKAFNLDFNRNGDTVTMNLNKPHNSLNNTPIDIDNRLNTGNTALSINSVDYPSKVSVQFSIDEEEEGFYRSVPNKHINDNDWKDYGEKGYDEVQISDVDDATETTLSVPFSYCWYNDFKINQYNIQAYATCSRVPYIIEDIEVQIPVPIIGKSEWWIEEYKYAEMAKNDGRSMHQRFWFRQKPSKIEDFTEDPMYEDMDLILPVGSKWKCIAEVPYYKVTLPIEAKRINGERIYLNYKNEENTLLRKFFNIENLNSSNDSLTIETYITPNEYKDILNGRNIHFNSDIYQVLNIKNYNPSNGKIKMTLLPL